jgi:predicted ATP-dependent endonuclease of OLD family
MKIETVRIENFRGFKDETIHFSDYTCFVGPNGAGKSTVMAALNVFFRQYKDSKTDLSKLSIDDFHHKDISNPIKITVSFSDLSEQAQKDLSDYVRQDKLIVSSIASYDPTSERAEVKQFGNRLGLDDFRRYFEAEKNGALVKELVEIYNQFKSVYTDLPNTKTKTEMAEALREYETNHPEKCTLIPSEDQFYGATKGANRLAPHIQWVFVSAVKDFTEESQETKTSALGQLLARTIRSKVNFSEKVRALRETVQREYQSILDAEQSVLNDLSVSLELKLKDWSHPNATAKILWRQDQDKSVRLEEPWAYIRLGERGFESDIERFGHGMQRSFMLTLLQEIASIKDENAPTLLMSIEEPELYQHPPQARYLAEVLHELSVNSSQIIICSHSPLFVPGDDFEAVRVVRETGLPAATYVNQLKYDELSNLLASTGQKLIKEAGMLAKLYPSLNPIVSEMFFCKVLILTEGYEDVAYLTTYLELNNLLSDFRKFGCHIVPVGGKSELIKPLAMAKLLKIPVYVICDADTNKTEPSEISKHKNDNKAILTLLGYTSEDEWPSSNLSKNGLMMWRTNITDQIHHELGAEWKSNLDVACAHYGNAGGLMKNPLVISRALESSWTKDIKSTFLTELSNDVVNFAKKSCAP